MALDLYGMIGRFTKGGNNTQQAIRLTSNGSVAVATTEPDFAEIARAGQRFGGGCQVIANGIAPVAAIPTTTATLALVNPASNTKSLLVDHLAFSLGSGTAAAGATLFAGLSSAAIATPSAASNYSSQSLSGGSKSTRAVWGTAVTFPSGTAWLNMGANFQLAAANVGQGDGPYSPKGILVPPGYALGIAILSGTGTSPLYMVSAMWTELELDLE